MVTRRELPWCPTPCPSGLGGPVPRLLDSRTLHPLGLDREGWREVRTSLVGGKMRSDYSRQGIFWQWLHTLYQPSCPSTGSCTVGVTGQVSNSTAVYHSCRLLTQLVQTEALVVIRVPKNGCFCLQRNFKNICTKENMSVQYFGSKEWSNLCKV